MNTRLPLVLSFGSTILPSALGLGLVSTSDAKEFGFVLLGVGLTLGPSIGSFYTGHSLRGFLFSMARALSVVTSFYRWMQIELCDSSTESCPEKALMFASLGVLAGLTVAELVWLGLSPPTVQPKDAGLQVTVAPMITPPAYRSSGASAGLGLSLDLRF